MNPKIQKIKQKIDDQEKENKSLKETLELYKDVDKKANKAILVLNKLFKNYQGLIKEVETLKDIKVTLPAEIKVNNLGDIPNEVKIKNFPDVQKVKVENDGKEPAWMTGLFKRFFETLGTLTATVIGKFFEAFAKLLQRLWAQGITVDFRKPQQVMLVDHRGRIIKEFGGGSNTTVYNTGGGSSTGKVKINPFKFGDNPSSYDVDNSAVQIYDSTDDESVVGLIITNSVDAGDLYVFNSNAVTTTNFLFKIGAGEDKQLAIGYDATGKSSLFAIRAAAQTNDDVKVTKLYEI